MEETSRKPRNTALLVVLVSGGALVLVAALAAIFSSGIGTSGRVGVVELTGPINTSRKVTEQLWEMAESGVDAVVLRIDSPGGGAAASQEIYEEVMRVREELDKPVVASMGGVAASGGYYAAIGCDRIVANPGTITGSMGVITQAMVMPELLTLAKVKEETFKSGALKDAGSPFRDMNEGDRALFHGLISDIFDQFRTAVQTRRGLSEEVVAKISDGRIVSGRQAKELGLVDELGNLGSAARLALELAGKAGRPKLVYPDPEGPAWLRGLVGSAVSEAVRSVLSVRSDVVVETRAPVAAGR